MRRGEPAEGAGGGQMRRAKPAVVLEVELEEGEVWGAAVRSASRCGFNQDMSLF